MNTAKLATAIREKSAQLNAWLDPNTGVPTAEDADTYELLCVLARIVEGWPIAKAFGEGEWGYGTPIGDALSAAPSPNYCP